MKKRKSTIGLEVCWAARQILTDGNALDWRKIRCMTNMRKENFKACVPYLTGMLMSVSRADCEFVVING